MLPDDQEFCVWPLTHDFEANPFRYDAETGRGSPLLWHCILALSYKHIHQKTGQSLAEAKAHKRKATQLLEELESDPHSPTAQGNLLDALLILMTLDCATSARGPWVSHLSRAHKILEAINLLGIPKTPRMQAQTDMLVWYASVFIILSQSLPYDTLPGSGLQTKLTYLVATTRWDVTLALTTRQGLVLSGPNVAATFSKTVSSTFYNVSGCPDDLFKYMFRLGLYAREFELAAHMTCVTFDMGPVLAVEAAIKSWRAPQFDDPDAEFGQATPCSSLLPNAEAMDPTEAMHYLQDLHHCAQAWRFALLLYIERVFKWQRDEPVPPHLGFLARKTLNNVSSCRPSVMVQKQLLLPVFLAGCETEDDKLREEARKYCSWWGEKTRYNMFLTTLGLLEEIWANKEPGNWWGSLMDTKCGVSATRQYLFG